MMPIGHADLMATRDALQRIKKPTQDARRRVDSLNKALREGASRGLQEFENQQRKKHEQETD